ncbi:MAG: Rpn family recombination-promoting nuclease/putative transposase [Bacteroidia bacterium]|nr:Rpn family recombination-promoting nuclease/putative transposase [Bacteroidia bacterium]
MAGTTDRYINLFTDFGFKKLFGEEPNKDLLISFLNSLLEGKELIADLTYLKSERLGKNEGERKAVYDLYCSNEKGEKFIVEIQRVKQEFFKDRSLYYSTFAIQEQALKGKKWNYELKAVYMIAVLDFEFSDGDVEKFHHRVKLIEEETQKVFYDKLSFIYLEIPKFDKKLDELASDYEKWLFAFKNLHRLREMPKELEEGIFKKLFQLAEIAKMKPKDRTFYEDSLKDYWDLKSSMETYFKEGKAARNLEMAKIALQEGLPIDMISKLTGLSKEDIEKLI